MNEFFVGKFRIDLSRCQIIAQDDIVSMEPKVLQVLVILAENQGEVVTHQTILDKVWPNIKVAPNALQRCIAQLRKAFDDDAKSQNVIATHPKIGYSLLSEVNWQSELSVSNVTASSTNSTIRAPKLVSNFGEKALVLTLSLSVILFVILFLIFKQTPENSLPLSHLTPLTTTDNKEFSPTYSPDGRYIAFQRYVGHCKNQIWAIDLNDNREYLLTKEPGIYGMPAWSPDSQQLAFSSVTRCGRERELRGCKDIRSLSVALAIASPQPTHQLLACEDQSYSAVIWLNNEKIAFNAYAEQRYQVMTLSLQQASENSAEPQQLYSSDDYSPYSLSYSARLNRLAIMQHDRMRNSSMVLLNPDSGDYKQVNLKVTPNSRDILYWTANWHPQNDSLITAHNDTFFEISLDGKITAQPIPTMQGIYDPYFHPDGNHIVASLGVYDTDVGEIKLDNNPTFKVNTIARSILAEKKAQYQPSGDKVAFISGRSGSNQIWLFDPQKDKNQQLSLSSNDKADVDSFIWSQDGQLIIYGANNKLHLLNLDGQSQVLPLPFKVHNIYQTLDNHNLLLGIVDNQQMKVIIFNINSRQIQNLYTGAVHWAQLANDNTLFISDHKLQFKQITNEQELTIQTLEDITAWSDFILRENLLTILDNNQRLWQYDIKSQSKSLLFKLKENVNRISDVDLEKKQLLVSQVVAARKEIVVFHR